MQILLYVDLHLAFGLVAGFYTENSITNRALYIAFFYAIIQTISMIIVIALKSNDHWSANFYSWAIHFKPRAKTYGAIFIFKFFRKIFQTLEPTLSSLDARGVATVIHGVARFGNMLFFTVGGHPSDAGIHHHGKKNNQRRFPTDLEAPNYIFRNYIVIF